MTKILNLNSWKLTNLRKEKKQEGEQDKLGCMESEEDTQKQKRRSDYFEKINQEAVCVGRLYIYVYI